MLRRPVKEQNMRPVMTLLLVDVAVSVASVLMPTVGFVIWVVQVDTSTVVVNVFRAVSVMTFVTVRMTVCTTVTLSSSSSGRVVVVGVAAVGAVGASSASVTGQ